MILNTENVPTGTDDDQKIVALTKNNHSHVTEYHKMSHISRMLAVRYLEITMCMIHKDIWMSHDLTGKKEKELHFYLYFSA